MSITIILGTRPNVPQNNKYTPSKKSDSKFL